MLVATRPLVRAAALAATLALARPAAAAERLEARTAVDVPVTLAAGAVFLALGLGIERQAVLDAPPQGRPGGIDALARLERDPAVARVSDLFLWGALTGGAVAAGVDGTADDEAADRLLLYAEAVALNGVLTETFKHAVRRPRPYTYDEREGIVDDDLSFVSGHTSQVATAAFFTARSLDLTGDLGAGGRAAVYGGAAALTAAVAALRVAAGMHYPSDVLVGGLVGGAVGWLVPELHRGGVQAAGGGDGARLSLTLAF